MTTSENPWFDLAAASLRLGFEAQDVIGMRLAKAAAGDFDTPREVVLMVTEKGQAALEVGVVVLGSMIAGQAHLAPARAVALFRGRVRANRRRLRGKP